MPQMGNDAGDIEKDYQEQWGSSGEQEGFSRTAIISIVRWKTLQKCSGQ